MKKRVLSIMLCIVMLVSLLPTTVWAVDTNEHTAHSCDASCGHIDGDPHKTVAPSSWQAWDKTDELPSSGNYYLTKDVVLSEGHTVMSALTICLNGHTITLGNGNLLVGNNFTITDCQGSGKITGANLTATGSVKVTSGTFNMYGGSITGNTAGNGRGGGVYMNGGTFNMHGGTISNNHAAYNGGGVHVEYGTFNMYGGEITDNSATEYGGGVYMTNSSTVNMSGGSITGNSAAYYNGGGVYVYNGTFTVSGNPVITGNTKGSGNDATANNLYLSSGKKATVGGVLSEDAKIGVTMQASSGGTFTSGWSNYMSSVADNDISKYFTSDSNNFTVQKSTNELQLVSTFVSVTGVTLTAYTVLDVGDQETLFANIEPSNATDKTVTWTSSNPTVAKVENGVVTALKPGSAIITVTTNDGNYTATCQVTVNLIPIPGPIAITVNPDPTVGQTFSVDNVVIPDGPFTATKAFSDTTIEAGEYYYLKITLRPKDGYVFARNIQATVDGNEASVNFDYYNNTDIIIEYQYSFAASEAQDIAIYKDNTNVSNTTQTITLPGLNEPDATMQFTAKVIDQYGQSMDAYIDWRISGDDTTGISVDETGKVTVTKDTNVGEYDLIATGHSKSIYLTIKVEKNPVPTDIKIFKDGNEVTADSIYIPESGQNTVTYTAVVYNQYGEVMSADKALITHENKNTTASGFGSAKLNDRSWSVYVDTWGTAGSFDLVLTSGEATASVHITFAELPLQNITCADVIGTYGQTEVLKLSPSGIETAGAYSFAIKDDAATDVIDVAIDGTLTIKKAGETTIVVTAPGDATHATTRIEVNVTINKANIAESDYTAPTANTLINTGSAQPLITEGSVDFGEMQYAIGTAEQATGSWSTAIPTGTSIGTYYVWYRIVGTENYNDKTFDAPIAVTIAPQTYAVTYRPGTNGTGIENTATKTQYTALTLANAIFTRTGYTQTGWATTDGDVQVYALGASYTADAPSTLYPVWTANTDTAYKVEHWQQNVDRNDYVKVDTDEKTGTTGTETEAAAKTYTGFTAQSFSQTTIAPDGSTVVRIDYIRNTYDVTYADTSAYLSNVTFEDVVYGAKAPTYPHSTTRTGYTLDGWYTDNELTTKWDFEADTISGPTILYAKWTINSHKLTWSNGDGGAYEQTLDYGTTIEVPADDHFNNTMRKAGYTLTGWLNAEDYKIGNTMPDQELTFTAQYTAHTYTVKFDANGGSGSMADMNFTYGESQELTAIAFTKANMHFNGWNDDSGRSFNNGDSVSNLTTENNGVVVLYAQWADKPTQTITFDTSDRNATYGDGSLDAREATAAGAITYSSDDETVATVDENGVVTVLNAGEVVITATAAETAEYASCSVSYKLIVAPKTLTITADSHEVYVGSRQPELTYTVEGLVGSDVLTTVPTLTSDANMNRAGTYAITFESLASTGNNYVINYVNGTLTVKNYPYIPQPTYDVEIADDLTGGEVSASKKLAYKGDTITLAITPDAGYELTALTVTDSRGNAVSVTKISDSKYTFKMPGYDVEVDAAFAKIDTDCPRDWTCPMYGYTDLDRSLWYHDGIHYCIEHGLMQGIGNNKFDPNGTTTRAMIVTILWRLEGSPVVNYAMSFEDVAADTWYTEAIRWAASEKIVEGYGNGKFGTNDAITREQMVTIMFRYAKYKGYDVSVGENTNILSYDDAFDVADWAIPAMQWACGSGMIQGIADGSKMNLAPQGNATRAQAAAILQRYVENVANKK